MTGSVVPMRSVPPIAPEMLERILPTDVVRGPINPEACGLYPVYRSGARNHCPGCGRTQWLIGRLTAECAFCSHALPLQLSEPAAMPSVKIIRRSLADGWPVEGR